jgi:hypothetical protein
MANVPLAFIFGLVAHECPVQKLYELRLGIFLIGLSFNCGTQFLKHLLPLNILLTFLKNLWIHIYAIAS